MFYEIGNALVPKSYKQSTPSPIPPKKRKKKKKEKNGKLQTNIPREHGCKNPNKILVNKIQQKWGLFQECKVALIFKNKLMLSILLIG